MTPIVRLLLCLFIVVCTAHCGTTSGAKGDLNAQARERYIMGMEELLDGNYTEAIMAFNQVAKNPGYVSFAALARIRVGDALFLQEKYDAAIEVYRSFLKQFEGDPNVGYAQFRIGHAFYEQFPLEWFLAPPVYERQQDDIAEAERNLRKFISLYPTHDFVPSAHKMLAECKKNLYEHEIYVARFYRKRDKPAGVVHRLERAFRKYPELAGTEDNYMALAQALAQTKAVRKSTALYKAYLERFPNGKYRGQAKESLRVLTSEGRTQG